jgi:hypothetical protein
MSEFRTLFEKPEKIDTTQYADNQYNNTLYSNQCVFIVIPVPEKAFLM